MTRDPMSLFGLLFALAFIVTTFYVVLILFLAFVGFIISLF